MQYSVFSGWWSEKSRKTEARSLLTTDRCSLHTRKRGFTLLELVITLTVLSIMTLGVVPLVKMSVRRQREQRLRDTLREVRLAIEEFHRDTIGMQCSQQGDQSQQNPAKLQQQLQQQQQQGGGPSVDPRSKVVISDCTIFTVDNPDHYPPDLDTLVNGVNIMPRGGAGPNGRVIGLDGDKGITDATNPATSTKKKVYLRSIPVDPITGEAEWELRSCYDEPDSASWGKENVFDVRSKAEGTALNGEKYRDW